LVKHMDVIPNPQILKIKRGRQTPAPREQLSSS
jgi:hypothetical protein